MKTQLVEYLDCRGLKCPLPIVSVSRAMRALEVGQRLVIEADDPAFKADISAWVERLGHTLVECVDGEVMRVTVEKAEGAPALPPLEPASSCSTGISPALAMLVDRLVAKRVDEAMDTLRSQVARSPQPGPAAEPTPAFKTSLPPISDRASLVVFSGEMDKLMAAFIIATGAAAMGLKVSMFFTFWGLVALKRGTIYRKKPLLQQVLSVMLPSGPDHVSTSRLNCLGLGPRLFKKIMRDNRVESLSGLIEKARELEVEMVACQMSMELLGITKEELIEGVQYGGVATYVGRASDSAMSLFV